MKLLRHNPLAAFVLGTFLWSWGVWCALMQTSLAPGRPLWFLIYLVGLSGPLVMAVLLTLAADGLKGLADLTRRIWPRNFSPGWLALALGLPPALGLGSLWLAHWLFGEAFAPPHPTFLFITGYFFMTLLRSGPLSEEFGWRGFLLPGLLKRFSPGTASLVLAPIWTAWHWPLWFLPLLPHKYFPFWLFTLMVFPMAFLFTWLHLRTRGSLLAALCFHAAVNASLFYLAILPPYSPSFHPFNLWITFSWIIALAVVCSNWREWWALGPVAARDSKMVPAPSAIQAA